MDRKRVIAQIRLHQRNILLFYLLSVCTGLAFIYDLVLAIYYQNFGLTFTEISFLFAIIAGTTLIAEVPTGVFADLYGKKKSILLGTLLFAVAFTMIVIGSTFVSFALASFCIGLSLAFSSGASQAFLYDTLKALKRSKDYLHVSSRMDVVWLVTTAGTSFFGPYLFGLNPHYPLIVSAIFSILAVLISLLLFEPPEQSVHKVVSLRQHARLMLRGFQYIIRRPILVWLLCVSVLGVITIRPFGEFLSVPFFRAQGFSMVSIGVLEMFATLLQAAILTTIPWIVRRFGRTVAWSLNLVGMGLMMFLVFTRSSLFLGSVLGILWGLASMRLTLFDTTVNEYATKKNRATIHSSLSFLASAVGLIALPGIGYLTDKTSTAGIVHLFAVCMFLGGTVLFIVYRKLHPRNI